MTLIRGKLPGGGHDSVKIRVASITAFLVMKSMALKNRLKEKDAWDIYYCVRYYPGGVDALAEKFRDHLEHGLVQQALGHLAEKFSAPSAVGPTHVANFEEIINPSERALIQRDAYELIDYLLKSLGY